LRKKIVFIVGPTAIGKTNLSLKLAKKIDGEIISADSMQAYKGMDIISQKPTISQQKQVLHHLVSFLSVSNEYSAAAFSKNARRIIKNIIKKGKTPIIVGGSGLYVKALVDGIFPSKGKDEALRKKLYNLVNKKGTQSLHDRLKKIDSESAKRIHPNDLRRIVRALEIYHVEKKTKTTLKMKTKGIKDEYDVKLFGLKMDREKLYKKINERIDAMFKKGVLNEVRELLKHDLSVTSRGALGIKEIKNYLEEKATLEEAREELKKNTRRFAKRQLTWFRPNKDIKWIDAAKGKKTVDKILELLIH